MFRTRAVSFTLSATGRMLLSCCDTCYVRANAAFEAWTCIQLPTETEALARALKKFMVKFKAKAVPWGGSQTIGRVV